MDKENLCTDAMSPICTQSYVYDAPNERMRRDHSNTSENRIVSVAWMHMVLLW